MYFSGFYKNFSEDEIKNKIVSEGFEPIYISNTAGFLYPQHSHPQTKLLAILKGSMTITVEDESFECVVGDKIVIPGNMGHLSIVGIDGCAYFWAESLFE